MLLCIRSITYLAERINGYELVDPNGHDLPPFEAGAHISVQLSEGLVRDFSLWNDPAAKAGADQHGIVEPELGRKIEVEIGEVVDHTRAVEQRRVAPTRMPGCDDPVT